LTLVFLPALYAIWFRINPQQTPAVEPQAAGTLHQLHR